MFSISEFQTQVRKRDFARPNRFIVTMGTPNSLYSFLGQDKNILSLFCESATLPPINIGVKQQRIYGPTYPRPFAVEYGGEGITLSFLLDGKMDLKGYFDAWMQLIVNPNSYNVSYPSEYQINMRISQLDRQDNEIYAVVIYDMFPRSMSLVELNQTSQNNIEKLNVTFTYRRWDSSQRALDAFKLSLEKQAEKNNPFVARPPANPPVSDQPSNSALVTWEPTRPLDISASTRFTPVQTGVFGTGTETRDNPWNPPTIPSPSPRSDGGDALDNFFNKLYGN